MVFAAAFHIDAEKRQANNMAGLDKSLVQAASDGKLGLVVDLLSRGANVQFFDHSGWTALFYACWNGHLDVVRYLVEGGNAHVNFQAKDGWAPLSCASRRGHLEIMEYLVQQGANPDVADAIGLSPLVRASQQGQINVVEWCLTKLGADPNLQDNRGWTALHHAVRKQHLETVLLLLDSGADWSIEDKKGKTATDISKNDKITAVLIERIAQGEVKAAHRSEEAGNIKTPPKPYTVLEPISDTESIPMVEENQHEEKENDARNIANEGEKLAEEDGSLPENVSEEEQEGFEDSIDEEQHDNMVAGDSVDEMSQKSEASAANVDAEAKEEGVVLLEESVVNEEVPSDQSDSEAEARLEKNYAESSEQQILENVIEKKEAIVQATSIDAHHVKNGIGFSELKTPVMSCAFFVILVWLSWQRKTKAKLCKRSLGDGGPPKVMSL